MAEMSVITMSIAVVNIVTNFLGILWFGPIAAGYTTLICSLLQALSYYFVVKKSEKNLSEIIDIKLLAFIIVCYVGVMVYSMIFYDSFWLRAGLVAVVILAICILRKKIISVFKNMKKKD